MAQLLENLDTILSRLPDISLPEFDFVHSSFFRRPDGADTGCKLPSPQEVLAASGVQPGDKGVWRFPERGLLVKFGHPSRLRLEEALTLRVINQLLPTHQIPAPEVFGWKSTHGPGCESNFIYMSLLPGLTLEAAWETLSHEDKTSVAQQLAAIVKCLRAVERDPADQVIGGWSSPPFAPRSWPLNPGEGSLSRGPVQDLYFSPQFHKGPFASAQEFHDFVEFISAPWVPMAERLPDPYRPLLLDTVPIFFSHADLYPANILVLKSPQGSQISISGIVDWEQAGWYPDYWEYCKP